LVHTRAALPAMRGVVVTPWRTALPHAPPPRLRCRRPAAAAAAASSSTPHVDAGDEHALAAWLSARGLPAQQVALREGLPGTGRGLVALTPLPAGAALLRVPKALLLTHSRALEDAPPSLRAALAALPEWSALALFLAAQRAALEQQQQNTSDAASGSATWAPYVAALPPATGALLDWVPGEGVRLLAGTSLAAQAAEREASVAAAIDDITTGAHAEVRLARRLQPAAHAWLNTDGMRRSVFLAGCCGSGRDAGAAALGVRNALFAPRAPARPRRRAGARAVGGLCEPLARRNGAPGLGGRCERRR
jgi:hypothetical protein